MRTEVKQERWNGKARRRAGRQRDRRAGKTPTAGKLHLMAKMRRRRRRRGMILPLIGNPIQSRPMSLFCACCPGCVGACFPHARAAPCGAPSLSSPDKYQGVPDTQTDVQNKHDLAIKTFPRCALVSDALLSPTL